MWLKQKNAKSNVNTKTKKKHPKDNGKKQKQQKQTNQNLKTKIKREMHEPLRELNADKKKKNNITAYKYIKNRRKYHTLRTQKRRYKIHSKNTMRKQNKKTN